MAFCKKIVMRAIFKQTWHIRSAQITALYSIGCQTSYVLTLQERPPPLSTFADLIPTLEVNFAVALLKPNTYKHRNMCYLLQFRHSLS